jgi:hypothetical protein
MTRALFLIFLLWSLATSGVAADLTLPSARIGGGGTSTGGSFTVRGKLSEPSPAGTAFSGGSFTVTGGVVSTVALVLTPGAPRLTLQRAGSGFELSWPLPAPGFVLQEAAALVNGGATHWTNSTASFTDLGGRRIVHLPPNGPRRFFRLINPAL